MVQRNRRNTATGDKTVGGSGREQREHVNVRTSGSVHRRNARAVDKREKRDDRSDDRRVGHQDK